MALALAAAEPPATFDAARARLDFPALHQEVHGRPLVYLDTAASAQKPTIVIDEMARLLREDYANIHRGIYQLSQRATDHHERARSTAQEFLNAADRREIVFTRGATESINLVAESYLRPRIEPGDEVLITAMEHHANIVPWQLLADRAGLRVVVAPINDEGELLIDALVERISERTRLIAFPWVANALGTINPVYDIVSIARARGIPTLVDAAQAVQHLAVDVQDLGCDFLAFSGHKLYGPSGIGVLYGRADLLEAMPPYQGGGDMIASVSFDGTLFNDIPYKFEAGTPAIEAAHGLGVAIRYVQALGLTAIERHETHLLNIATRALQQIPGLRLVGTARNKCSVLSFVLERAHPQDIGTLLDLDGVAIRTGHHCAQPVIERLGYSATARASFGLYNTEDDVEALAASVRRAAEMFS